MFSIEVDNFVVFLFVGAVFFVGGIAGNFKDFFSINKKWHKRIFVTIGSVLMIISLIEYFHLDEKHTVRTTKKNNTEQSEVSSPTKSLNENKPKETSTTKDSIKGVSTSIINEPEISNTQTKDNYREKKEKINPIDIQFNELLTKFESKEFDCKDIILLVEVYIKKLNKSEKKKKIVQVISDFEKEIDASKLIGEERLEMEDCILAINKFKDSI